MPKETKRIEHDGKLYEYSPSDPATRDPVFEELLDKCMPLIKRKARAQGNLLPYYDRGDWRQVGRIALFEAMERWRETPADSTVRPRKFFSYFWRYLDLKIRQTHTKYNMGYKAILSNRGIERRRAVPGNCVRPTTKLVDMEQVLSLSRMEGIDEPRAQTDGSFVNRLAALMEVRKLDWSDFLNGLHWLERRIVELVIDGTVTCVDQDSVEWISLKLRESNEDASESDVRMAVRNLRMNGVIMGLAMGV